MEELEDLMVWINKRRLAELDLANGKVGGIAVTNEGEHTCCADYHYARASAFEEMGNHLFGLAEPDQKATSKAG